ncbi:ribonuclease H-like domain-containing protein [Tanacetum coccineum]
MGEGLANPTDPRHIPTIIKSSTQPQKIQKPRKPKRKDTEVPQPSDPSKNVVNKVDHKELGDSLVRAATIASSLEAEQDSGNITKTKSKATPNESTSLGATSGGGPKYQETIVEKTKTTQANEIPSLKRRVKKLEKKRSSRTHKLNRLYKVGLSARVESSGDEEDLDDVDNENFDVDALNGEEVFVAGQSEKVVEEVVDAAQAKIEADHELAQRLQAEEQEELSDAEKATLFQQLLEKRRKHFAAKRAEEKRNKPPTQAPTRKIISFKRVNTFVDFRTDLVEGSSKRAGEELYKIVFKRSKMDLFTKIHEEGKKSYYQIIRADGKSQMYMIFSHMLKSFDREDLETLYKLVKAKYKSTRPVEDLNLDATCADLHVGRKEISPYTTYNYRYAEQEASGSYDLVSFAAYAARVGFHHSRCDSSLFIYRHGYDTAYLLLYVDDIVLTASSSILLQQYATEVLERANMLTCNPCRTPVDTYIKITANGDPVSDLTLYRRLAGALKVTLGLRLTALFFLASSCGILHEDWVAKYRGVANEVAETCWLRNLLRELYTPLSTVTIVYCDNVSVVYLSSNPVQHQRMKHIEIDIHFVRGLVTTGHVRVLHVPSCYIFTKGLPNCFV